MAFTDPIGRFRALMQFDNERVNLAEAALAIAATEYPGLDIPGELASFDRLASRLEADASGPPLANIARLNRLLFEEEKFAGNEEEYDDPRNSYLNDVLARKKGIPITLSVVYLEVARRRGLPVWGVGFPAHFLVKYVSAPSEIIVDPYHRGAILDASDCTDLLKAHFGKEAELKPQYLSAATTKEILARMLNNLKGSYFRRANYPKVLTMIELALTIDGGTPQDLRDRGMVYLALRRYPQALADLKLFLELSPQQDAETKTAVQAIHRILAMMN